MSRFDTRKYLRDMNRAQDEYFDRVVADAKDRERSAVRLPPGVHHPDDCLCIECENLTPRQRMARRRFEK